MGKKLLCLCLLLACLTLQANAEEVLVNKIAQPDSTFEFAADAPLLEVWFPEIFGCDAALVRYGEFTALIDGATPKQADAVLAMLEKAGVSELTYAINSHPDPDHMGGFNIIFASVPVQKMIVGFPETGLVDEENQKFQTMLYTWMQELNIPIERMADGQELPFSDVSFRFLQRYDEQVAGINNSSLMCMVGLGERNIFFTGDIQLETQLLLKDSGDIQADILKFSHHGYRRANEGFIRAVAPVMTVLTGGSRSSAEAKAQLKDMGLRSVVTDAGMLHFSTDGTVWVLERLK